MIIEHINLPTVPYEKSYKAPLTSIYFLYFEEKLVYIGKTVELDKRLISHLRDKFFDSYSYTTYECKEEASKVERENINYYKPVFNDSLSNTITKDNRIFYREFGKWKESNVLYHTKDDKKTSFIRGLNLEPYYYFFNSKLEKIKLSISNRRITLNRDKELLHIIDSVDSLLKVINTYPFLQKLLISYKPNFEENKLKEYKRIDVRTKISNVLRNTSKINDWEKDFIRSVSEVSKLSTAQLKVINKLYTKVK